MPYNDNNKARERSRQYYETHKAERAEYLMEYRQVHKQEAAKKNKQYRLTHKVEIANQKRQYYLAHKVETAERDKRYYQANRAEKLKYARQYHEAHKAERIEYRQANRVRRNEQRRMHAIEMKGEVLTHYGDGRCACIKCGFNDIRALSIDHINGGGNKHRQIVGIGGGGFFYNWLKRNNLPEGYQTLCMNCQFISRIEGMGRGDS